MSLISLEFLGFLLAVLVFYYLFPLKFKWLVLLAGSIFFYVSTGPDGLPYLTAVSVIAYLAALGMQLLNQKQEQYFRNHEVDKDEKRKQKARVKKKCKIICVGASLVIILLLIWAKVGNLEWFHQLTGYFTGENQNVMNVIVPLGVSYYTFSAVAYVADVYWKKDKAETNYLKFALFLFYFPKILEGPISRHKNIGQQLCEGHRFDFKGISFGAQRMLWGFFKKMVIADRVAIVVNEVFGNWEEYPGSILLLAAVFGAFQLYCDFSGCMDIVCGASEMVGVKLEDNFSRPFFAKSAAEFWRRWHITLGTWFKDYIYMPIVVSPRMMKIVQKTGKIFGKRAGKTVMSVIPLFVVWLLTGLWHGTGLAYVAWGLYWGGLIIVSTVFEPEIKKVSAFLHIRTDSASWNFFRMVRTFFIFVVSRIITIPNNLQNTKYILGKIVTDFQVWKYFDGSLFDLGLDRANFLLCFVLLLVLWAVSMLQEKGSVRERIAGWNIVFRWALYYAAFFAVLIFGIYGLGYDAASFVYMNY